MVIQFENTPESDARKLELAFETLGPGDKIYFKAIELILGRAVTYKASQKAIKLWLSQITKLGLVVTEGPDYYAIGKVTRLEK